MVDREKVIKGLEYCIEKLDTVVIAYGFNCTTCPYFRKCDRSGYFIGLPLMRDVLALLKAQDPAEPIQGRDDQDEDIFCCGVCGAVVGETYLGPPGECEVRDNYCPECGRAVKWE